MYVVFISLKLNLHNSPSGNEVVVDADVFFGCDGAYSSMRTQMMRTNRMNFKQEYIPHGYMELNMPAKENGQVIQSSSYS